MTKRRKFLAGLGALASGSAAAVGTGAMTSMQSSRSVTVGVETDENAQIALEASSSLPDISQTSEGELKLDLTGKNGQGVNVDSTYQWGDTENHESQYAFKIHNQDEEDYNLKLYHEFDTIPTGSDPSQIKYYVFDGDGAWDFNSAPYEYSQAFPDGDNSTGENDALTRGFGQPASGRGVDSGEAVYVVIEIDTTGADASKSDSLSGETVIEMERRE
jgi:hypothetical protein